MRQDSTTGVAAIFREARAGGWELRRSAAWLGGLVVAAAFLATVPFFSLLSAHLAHSNLSTEMLRFFSGDALVDFGIHRGEATGPAMAGFLALLFLAGVAGLFLGPGLLAQAATGPASPALGTMLRGGFRHAWRSFRLALLVGAAALVPLALVGGAAKGLEDALEIPLMDERLWLAFAASRGALSLAIFLLARGAWNVARLETIRSEPRVGILRAWRYGWVFVLRRPLRAILLEGGAIVAALLVFAIPVGFAVLISGSSAGTVALQAAFLALAVFLFPVPRVFAAAGWAAWHREERAPDRLPVAAVPSDEPPAAIGSPLPDDVPASGSAAVEPPATVLPPPPPAPRPSKEITAPLRIERPRAETPSPSFPANLPKGIGVEVMTISRASTGLEDTRPGITVPEAAAPLSSAEPAPRPPVEEDPFEIGGESSLPPPTDEVPTDPIPRPAIAAEESPFPAEPEAAETSSGESTSPVVVADSPLETEGSAPDETGEDTNPVRPPDAG